MKKTLLKILKQEFFHFLFLIIFTILILISLGFLPHKNYGVDKEAAHMECSGYLNYGITDNGFDFHPHIYTGNKECKNIKNRQEYFSDIKFMKVILHPLRSDTGEKYEGLISTLEVLIPKKSVDKKDNSNNETIELQKDSIRLIYKTKEGSVIPFDHEEFNAKRSAYRQFYKGPKLPERINVFVHLQMTVDGKPLIIEKELPLQLENEYTFWGLVYSLSRSGISFW